MVECPKFDYCNVNHCPLDEEQAIHFSVKEDPEYKCTLKKSIRVRLGTKLLNRGLKGKEIGGTKSQHPEIFK